MGLEAGGRTTRRHALGVSLLALGGALGGRPARAAPPAHRAQPWPADKPTPDLSLPDLDGRAWRLAGARGQVVVLNFWATWCEPCRAEMPSLGQLRARHAAGLAAGLAVVTVNYKETAADIRRYLQAGAVDLPVLLDADGEGAGAWTPRVFPTTVLVDRGGRARTVVVGGIDWAGREATALLKPLLAAPRTS